MKKSLLSESTLLSPKNDIKEEHVDIFSCSKEIENSLTPPKRTSKPPLNEC